MNTKDVAKRDVIGVENVTDEFGVIADLIVRETDRGLLKLRTHALCLLRNLITDIDNICDKLGVPVPSSHVNLMMTSRVPQLVLGKFQVVKLLVD